MSFLVGHETTRRKERKHSKRSGRYRSTRPAQIPERQINNSRQASVSLRWICDSLRRGGIACLLSRTTLPRFAKLIRLLLTGSSSCRSGPGGQSQLADFQRDRSFSADETTLEGQQSPRSADSQLSRLVHDICRTGRLMGAFAARPRFGRQDGVSVFPELFGRFKQLIVDAVVCRIRTRPSCTRQICGEFRRCRSDNRPADVCSRPGSADTTRLRRQTRQTGRASCTIACCQTVPRSLEYRFPSQSSDAASRAVAAQYFAGFQSFRVTESVCPSELKNSVRGLESMFDVLVLQCTRPIPSRLLR